MKRGGKRNREGNQSDAAHGMLRLSNGDDKDKDDKENPKRERKLTAGSQHPPAMIRKDPTHPGSRQILQDVIRTGGTLFNFLPNDLVKLLLQFVLTIELKDWEGPLVVRSFTPIMQGQTIKRVKFGLDECIVALTTDDHLLVWNYVGELELQHPLKHVAGMKVTARHIVCLVLDSENVFASTSAPPGSPTLYPYECRVFSLVTQPKRSYVQRSHRIRCRRAPFMAMSERYNKLMLSDAGDILTLIDLETGARTRQDIFRHVSASLPTLSTIECGISLSDDGLTQVSHWTRLIIVRAWHSDRLLWVYDKSRSAKERPPIFNALARGDYLLVCLRCSMNSWRLVIRKLETGEKLGERTPAPPDPNNSWPYLPSTVHFREICRRLLSDHAVVLSEGQTRGVRCLLLQSNKSFTFGNDARFVRLLGTLVLTVRDNDSIVWAPSPSGSRALICLPFGYADASKVYTSFNYIAYLCDDARTIAVWRPLRGNVPVSTLSSPPPPQ